MLRCAPYREYRWILLPQKWYRPLRLSSFVNRTFFTTLLLPKEADYHAAREWFRNFTSSSIHHNIGKVTYSRSSGPGGQNVNKVNSKAQLRVSLDQLLPLIPQALHEGLRSSPYLAAKSSSLLIQADESRKQAANKDACYRKLHELIVNIYFKAVPGETSEAQKDHVKELKTSENESRLRLKKHISNKKAARRRGAE